ncbi:MAG: endonuclease/exonuclease/phosphatase family protein [Asticcacaulis sp.]
MQKLFVILLCALCLTGEAMAQTRTEGSVLRVMSYNIRYDGPDDRPNWRERRPHMSAQIRFFAPDILGVQEALPHMVDGLAVDLTGYDHYGLGRDDGKVGESTTVFYNRARFERLSAATQWCSPAPDRPGKAYDAAYPRTITRLVLKDRRTGQVFDVRNTHFDHVGEAARQACARQLKGMAAFRGARVIVMGDFNTGPDSEAYRILTTGTGLTLQDTRRLSPIVFGPQGTFNGFDIRRSGTAIDHIFVGEGLDVERFGVLTDSFDGQVISDHFPLVADIRLEDLKRAKK